MPSLSSQRVEGPHGVVVPAGHILHAARVFPVAVFGSHAGIVESGGNRMDVARLAVFVLHHVAEAAVQDARLAVASAATHDRRAGRLRPPASTPSSSTCLSSTNG